MFDRVKDKWRMIKYSRHGNKMLDAQSFVFDHFNARCSYCDESFGPANKVIAIDFLDHLIEKHKDNVDEKEASKIKKMLIKIY